jgi:hypothetical protein
VPRLSEKEMLMMRTSAAAAAILGLLLSVGNASGQETDLAAPAVSTAPDAGAQAADASSADAGSMAATYRKAMNGYRGLAAGYVFQTHLAIGMVAELSAGKLYGTEQALGTLERMTGGMTAMGDLLRGLSSLDLPEADRQMVLAIHKLTAETVAQAKTLSKYLLSRDPQDAAAYQRLRGQTGEAINKFLGLN